MGGPVSARPLHVGLVGPLPPPFGGMANQTRQLAEMLGSEGVAVSVVQVNAAYRPAWVGQIPLLRAVFRLLPYLSSLWRVSGRSDLLHVMANSGWSWHLFAVPAVWIARLRRIPAVVNYRGGEAERFLEKSHALIAWTLRRASVLAVPSGFLQQVFARFGIDATIVPNIVNLDRFSGAATPRPRGHRLLVARNLEPIYDNATAIRAFALIHAEFADATLTIAGSGPEADALQALARSLGLADAVRFAGRLTPEAMADLYRQSDVAINASLVDNMPNSVLEAMASGVPVVSTDVGGVPYIVSDGETALLVPPAAPDRMAAAVLRLFADPVLYERLASQGIAEVQRYTWNQVWPVWAETYRRAAPQAAWPRANS